MENKIQFFFSFFFIIFLLSPSYVVCQDSFKGNSGEAFTPSTIIIIIMAIVFLFTGCLAVFLRRFSAGCFGLHVVPLAPGITADGQLDTRGIDAEVIKAIPTYLYADVKQHRKGQVELECAVCLNEFQDPEALRLLPGCSHVFHPRCIDQWLGKHVTCPICRQSLEQLQSGSTNKPHTIININNIIVPNTPQDNNQSDGSQHDTTRPHDHPATRPLEARDNDDDDDDDDDVKKIIVGKFPRSHSTGHSMADSEKFKLVLPEEVQNNLSNRSKELNCILSPRSGYKCGWFSMTPPVNNNSRVKSVHSLRGLAVSNSCKNLTLSPVVKTSDRLWPI